MLGGTASQPLHGVRVVELATGVAGCYLGKVLADFGADVVKVEPPGGDPVRRWGPFPGEDPGDEVPEQGALHLHLNTNKRSIVAELADPDGLALVRSLVAGAQLVLEAFPPGTLARHGLGWDALHAAHPALSLVSVTPFGQTGPYAGWRGAEIVSYAMGGPMHATGVLEREPLKLAGNLVGYQCGALAAVAALAALAMAERSGQGTHVDVSNFETQAASIDRRMVFLQQHLYNGRVMQRSPEGARGLLPTGIFPTADGWVQVGTPPPYAPRLVAALGDDELAALLADPAWVTNPDVPGYAEAVLYGWLLERSTEQVVAEAQRHHWPVTALRGPGEVLTDPQFTARGFFHTVEHPAAGPVRQPGAPVRMDSGWRLRRPAPQLDQHRDELRAEVGAVPAPPAPPLRPADPGAANRLPLDGVRVLDLTVVWAGPYTTMLLGDLGADVIRVESAQRNGVSRGPAPRPPKEQLATLSWLAAYPDDEPGPRPWNRNAFFNIHARNKRSVTVDLVRAEGREAFLRLAEQADVVVENNAVGVCEKLGIGWEDLRRRNPRLIMLRMPALGLDGPSAGFVGFGANFEAMCGLTALRGYADGEPSRTGPVYFMDTASGAAGAVATLLALRRRQRTGVGELIELAQGDNMLNLIGEYLIDAARTGRQWSTPGNRHLVHAPTGAYRCQGDDAWVVLSVVDDEAWAGLRRAMGDPAWAAAEQLATAAGRRADHDELDRHLTAWTSALDRWEVTRRCQDNGVAAGPVLGDADCATDPHLRARGFFRRNGSDEVGWHDYPGHVWRWNGPPLRWEGLCPLGGANDTVWRDVAGLDDATLADLRAGGHLQLDFVDADGAPY